ncbi:hypothetical protein EYF80_040616 [Liparis tanakae]|uniref:Uncharacterized protein n=1 Tax=Liparis tanakae TaxID=230148 RepID=A0A4Z2G6K6_9TELE|nr:hypothetical protein EYF80_040616 [Liparis tanakae]
MEAQAGTVQHFVLSPTLCCTQAGHADGVGGVGHNQRTTAFLHPTSGQISTENMDFILQEHGAVSSLPLYTRHRPLTTETLSQASETIDGRIVRRNSATVHTFRTLHFLKNANNVHDPCNQGLSCQEEENKKRRRRRKRKEKKKEEEEEENKKKEEKENKKKKREENKEENKKKDREEKKKEKNQKEKEE